MCVCVFDFSWRTVSLSECKCQCCHGSVGVVVKGGCDPDAMKSVLILGNCRGACGGGVRERCEWLRWAPGHLCYVSPGVRCR